MILNEMTGGLGKITLARPEKANALTRAMLRDLLAALEAMAADPGLRGLILTGAGSVFSAGADLDEVRAGLATAPEWERLSARLAAMPCLTVAALNGTVAGGAMGMVLACDIRLAVPDARFFYPVMRLALRFPILGIALFATLGAMHHIQDYIWSLGLDPGLRDYLIRATKAQVAARVLRIANGTLQLAGADL